MLIVQLNSKHTVPDDHREFARQMISHHDQQIPWSRIYPTTITEIMNEVPVLLVNELTQEESQDSDILGFYCHECKILNASRPVIGLCMERIRAHSKSEEELKMLTTKVLIHEYSHALMAKAPGSDCSQRDPFYRYMEEPLANMITLQYFSHSDQQAFSYARTFMESQPDEYKLGANLYDAGIHQWWLWRNRKEQIATLNADKENWLNYVRDHSQRNGQLDSDTLMQLWWNLIEPDEELREGIALIHHVHAPLFIASQNGDSVSCTKLLANNGITPNIQDPNGRTPLFHAVEGGHVDVCRVLTDNGASVNHQDIGGQTPLHVAVKIA